MTVAFSFALWMTTLTHLIIFTIFWGISMAAFSSVIFAVIADTNDEVVNAAGRHIEATLMGIRAFFTRVAYLVTGVIIATVHIATGYVPGAATQTDLAIIGVRIHTGLFPALFVLIAAILMLKFYDLKGEKKDQLAASIREKGL